ncbi:hypothetical protein BN2476_520102 [Paraburkholderia piptadeniae]|uniref:Uncharacterized protein n=1 Tax=Paraburkholderia piptadeniae TaxID=1701573 RepID=A0A1N7SH91_9BURK|nr:hypothetical protein BN2476_520102 [Paraburkholderia piptadeniae]
MRKRLRIEARLQASELSRPLKGRKVAIRIFALNLGRFCPADEAIGNHPYCAHLLNRGNAGEKAALRISNAR